MRNLLSPVAILTETDNIAVNLLVTLVVATIATCVAALLFNLDAFNHVFW